MVPEGIKFDLFLHEWLAKSAKKGKGDILKMSAKKYYLIFFS